MSGYTITITPNSAQEHTPIAAAQTTIKVDTSSGEPRITEVTIRSAAPGGVLTGSASVVDLDLLVRALTLGTNKPNNTPEEPTTQGSDQTRDKTGGTLPASAPKTSASHSDRTYRRMPDPSAVLSAYEQIGTITGMAKYFGVPRYTAQGWMTRIRKQGGEEQQSSAH